MVAFRGLSKYLKSIEASHDKIRNSEATGQNVCFIDMNGLPAGKSENALIRMDAFDDRLCTIKRNIATANNASDTLEMPRPEHSYKENQTRNDVAYDQHWELASQDVPIVSAYEAMASQSNALLAVASRYYSVGKLAGFQAKNILINKIAPIDLPILSLSRYLDVINMRQPGS
ncbi:hypothetical protein D1BOALGB6SA_4805 [Olavius sp. associated proteobacterium Delta 1]|nr:hypothetical protein D1BOALGB6SA_4805 [Olavius sp. associated proteobacterium Delta 1]